MKILLPAVEIGEKDGFSDEIDIFRRKGFGERLANLIENANDNPVIALDAGWGEGKSTFIKMWMGYLEYNRQTKLKTIYFDAFENDYQKDPFLTLASEMYQMFSDEKEEEKTEFRKKASKAVKSLTRGALKIGVKAVTAGIVDGSCVDSLEKDLSNLAANQIDEIIKDKFKNAEEDKLALTDFKTYLEAFANNTGEGKPIIFIVDELDRCRPDFALELLEQIKHLFSVKGITFLLVTNRNQLEEIIKAKYGTNIDPTNYLHKFVNLWLSLPMANDRYNDNKVAFLKYAISGMEDGKNEDYIPNYLRILTDIVKFYKPSFREIERMLTYFAIIQNMAGGNSFSHITRNLIAIVCYFKSCRPNILNSIINDEKYEKILELAGLDSYDEESDLYSLRSLKRHIKFDLSSMETKNEMVKQKEIRLDHWEGIQENILKLIIGWLSDINKSWI